MPSRTASALRVAIIGAGFSGITAARYLTRDGYDCTIFESSAGVGGTWRFNTYPGAEVDTPSHMYSFSFRQNDWTRDYAQQAELEAYLNATVDDLGLRPLFRFETFVRSLLWSDGRQQWLLTTAQGATEWFDVVVTAVGALNVPKEPHLGGRDSFGGRVFHTARWDHSVDLAGQRVAVIGTGASAVSVVPALAGTPSELLVFQREPGWIDPKKNELFSDADRIRYRNPREYQRHRMQIFAAQERRWFGGRVHRSGSSVDVRLVANCLNLLNNVFAERPDLKAAFTPNGGYLSKRPTHSSTYYQAFLRNDVRLIPHAAAAFTRDGLVDSTGMAHPVDVVVMATGFQPARYLHQIEIIGRGGRNLQEKWGDDPMAFLGCTVDEMPNLFMMFGPNTTNYAPVFNFEQQAKFAVRSLRTMRRRGASSVEVKAGWVAAFNRWLESRMRGSSFAEGNNYFKSASGRVVTQWPDGSILYWLLTRTTYSLSARFRRSKGLETDEMTSRESKPVRQRS